MTASLEDLERRVSALESRVRASEVDQATVNEKLNGILGSQDVMLGILRDHGRLLGAHDATLANHTATLANHTATLAEHTATLTEHSAKLAEHDTRFDRIDDKLDLIVDWVQAHP